MSTQRLYPTAADALAAAIWLQEDAAGLYAAAHQYRTSDALARDWLATLVQDNAAVHAEMARDALAQYEAFRAPYTILSHSADTRLDQRGMWHARVRVGETVYNVGTHREANRRYRARTKRTVVEGYVRLGAKDLLKLGEGGLARYLLLAEKDQPMERAVPLLLATAGLLP